MTKAELYDKILEKSKKDKNFKKNLLDDPKKTIESEYDIKFGDKVQVSVYQSTSDHMHYVIPLYSKK